MVHCVGVTRGVIVCFLGAVAGSCRYIVRTAGLSAVRVDPGNRGSNGAVAGFSATVVAGFSATPHGQQVFPLSV